MEKYDAALSDLENALSQSKKDNSWGELEAFREKYRALLIRYNGYCSWVNPHIAENERPLFWGDKTHRAKWNRNYRYHYNEAEENFDLMDTKTERLIEKYYSVNV